MDQRSVKIDRSIVDAILAGRLRPGARLVEQAVASVFDVSRTIVREREAIAANDVAARSYLLADFHGCMVECLNNRILADIPRDPTARTILIAALSQTAQDATVACDEHEQITDLLADGNNARAAQQMVPHIDNVEAGLTKQIEPDPLIDLRTALQHPLKTEKDRT
jgi:DNA-binding GntR family transcriptional regulator